MPGDGPPLVSSQPKWLADLLPRRDAAARPLDERNTHALAAVLRSPGPRVALARAFDGGEATGVDLVHAACQQLLALGALPSLATLQVTADEGDAFAESAVVGVLRACRAHGIELLAGGGGPGGADGAGGVAPFGLALSLFGPAVGTTSHRPAPGDVVLALRGAGPGDGDLAPLEAHAARLGITLASALPDGELLGAVLVAARRSHVDVVQRPLRERWPCRLAAVGDVGLGAAIAAMLPAGCGVVWDFVGWSPPEPFRRWWPDAERLTAAAAHTSCGVGMLVCCAPAEAERWQRLCAAWNEPATPIARIVAAP